ncbi:integrase, catalytic region, zinc finger, CCHC-type containing protein [Tanacetum coccineum]
MINSSAWKKSDTQDALSGSSKQQSGPHAEQPVEDIPIQDSGNISDLEDTDSAHLPKTKQRPEWLKPMPDDERPATPELAWVIPTSHIPNAVNNWANALATTYQASAENSLLAKTGNMRTFMNWYCQNMGKTELTQEDLIDIRKPLPLSGPPGHVTIQTQFFFNKDLDYLRYGSKGSGQALSISKLKVARYHYFRLELLVPEHMWIDDVCTSDISASYGISHWWFNRQKFFIDRHIAESSRRADHQKYTIAEKDFKNLYPSDFEDLNLLLLQGHLNHLPGSDIRMISTAVKLWTQNLVIRQRVKDFQLGIKSYQKQLNLTKPGWDATGFEFKHDYTIIDSPSAVVFPVSNNERKIMRFNEIYMFSDGALTNIMEALDYRVKEYKDVPIKRTCKLGDSDVHTLEDPTLILEILSKRFFLRLNLPDHKSVLTGSGGPSKDGDGDTSFQWSLFHNRMLILNRYINDLMKAQVYVSKLSQLWYQSPLKNILQSIDEGPFKMGKFRETLADGAQGPERDKVFKDLTPEEKDRYKADIRATNILLQGLPKYIYTLINHYTKAKYIWDNVKMLLEGSELTKDERESQLYDDFEHFLQNKEETIHEYYFYAYLKKHKAHANKNKIMLERYTQHAIDPLAFVSNVSPQQYPIQSSAIPQSGYVPPVTYQPQFADNTQLDSRLTPTDDLIENITKTNRVQGNNARGAVAAGNEGVQNRVGNANPVQAKPIKCYNCNGIGNIARQCTHSKRPHNSDYFKDKQLMQAQENRVVLDEEQLLFIAGGQDHTFNDDVDEPSVQDLALNVDKVFQADQCDASDSDVEYMSDSNIIPYEQYVKNNAEQVVQSNVSSVPNDALMMIINDMQEQAAQCISANEHNKVVNESLTAELARYKEQVEIYEKEQVNGYGKTSDVETACELFNRMVKEGIRPDLKSYKILVECLCLVARVDDATFGTVKRIEDALERFDEMRRGISLNLYTYNVLILIISKRLRSTRGQSSSSQEVSIEEKVRRLRVFENSTHQLRYDTLARRPIHPGDVIDWEFLANQGLARSFLNSINTDLFSGPQWMNLFQINEYVYREIGLYTKQQSRDRETLSGLSRAETVKGCCWPATWEAEVKEEDEGGDGRDETVRGYVGHEGVGGSTDIYHNMSQGDWQVRQARWMDQQDEQ